MPEENMTHLWMIHSLCVHIRWTPYVSAAAALCGQAAWFNINLALAPRSKLQHLNDHQMRYGVSDWLWWPLTLTTMRSWGSHLSHCLFCYLMDHCAIHFFPSKMFFFQYFCEIYIIFFFLCHSHISITCQSLYSWHHRVLQACCATEKSWTSRLYLIGQRGGDRNAGGQTGLMTSSKDRISQSALQQAMTMQPSTEKVDVFGNEMYLS